MTGVSYVITLYNKRPFLPYVLHALSAQSGGFEREFIFIDDGSTDGSGDFVERETSDWPNAKVIRQKNSGPAIAVNSGAEQAKHPFLKMVDGDDVLFPYCTEMMLQVANQYELDAVYSLATEGTSWRDYEAGLDFPPRPETIDVTVMHDTVHYVLKRGWSGSSNLLVRKDAFLAVGGCDERVFIQDWSVPLRLSPNYRIGYFGDLICYGPKAAEGRITEKHEQMIHDLCATQLNFLSDNPDLPYAHKHLILKRCLARSWKWAKRENGTSILSPYLRYHIFAYLPLCNEFRRRIAYRALHVYEQKKPIRRPGPLPFPVAA